MNNLQFNKFNALSLVEVLGQSTSTIVKIFGNSLTKFVIIFCTVIFVCVSSLTANAADSKLDRKLINALYDGNSLEYIKRLVEQGADVNTKSDFGKTPLYIAFIHIKLDKFDKQFEIIKYLVEKGANINTKDKDGDTPFLIALIKLSNRQPLHTLDSEKQLEIIKYLVENGADVNTKGRWDRTPLHHACSTKVEIIQYLIDKGADINVKDKGGTTPLHQACSTKFEIVKYLVEKGADINAKDKEGRTPLHHACSTKFEKVEMVKYLVEKGANVNAKDENGTMPLHWVRDSAVFKYLIGKGANIEVKNDEDRAILEQSLLRVLNKAGDLAIPSEIEVIKYFIEKGGNVNAQNKYHNTFLMLAISDLKTVEYLIKKGADVNVKNEAGDTPLLRAIKRDCELAIIKCLVEHGADVNVPDASGKQLVTLTQNPEIAKYLAQKGSVDIWNAIKSGDLQAVVKRIETDPKIIQATTMDKITDDANSIIKIPRNINVLEKRTPLHVAALNPKSIEVLKYLIKKNADTDVEDGKKMTPLFLAIAADNEEAACYLIANGAEPPDESHYYLPAYEDYLLQVIAATTGRVERQVLRETDDYKVVLETTDLRYAISTYNEHIKRRTRTMGKIKSRIEQIKKTKNLANYRLKAPKPTTSVENAIRLEDSVTLSKWIAFKPSIVTEKNTYDGSTLLHKSAGVDINLVKCLVKNGADVHAKDKEGRTPIFNAVAKDKQDIVEYLLQHGEQIDIKDEKNRTLLFYAAELDKKTLAEFLINKGADIHAKDTYGNNLLHHVVLERVVKYKARDKSQLKMLEFLKEKGVDINAKNRYGDSPFDTIEIKVETKPRESFFNFGPENKTTADPQMKEVVDEIKSLLRPTGTTKDIPKNNSSSNTSRNKNDTKIVSNLSNQPTNTANKQDRNKNSNPFIISPQEESPPVSPQKTDTKEQKTTSNTSRNENDTKIVSNLSIQPTNTANKQDRNKNSNPFIISPEELIKQLQNISGLKPVVDVQRFVNLLEFADASQNDELYFDLRKKFFHAIKTNIKNSYTRIEFVEEILPAMIRRNNFDGLKASITDIDVIMEQPARINPSGWQKYNFYCAKLAGLALAMGDNETARAQIEIGTANFSEKQRMIYRQMKTWLARAVAMKNISRDKNGRCNLDEMFKTPLSNRDNVRYFGSIAYYLAKIGDAEATAEFAGRFRQLRYYDSYCEFSLAKADSLVGEFDRARLNWKKYPTNDTGLWSLYLLSFIVRQEFLAGEFRGWETMAMGEKGIDKLRAVYKGDDFSQCVSGFYFDYGRGIARHKSEKEIIDESE
ncbi:MAG: ankyrin repeat domain-containing protein, partial [Planctomycetaceae bacterium]|nr:ankyrin repeat domain-containing protein [Planctomycetaceae bacterium]